MFALMETILVSLVVAAAGFWAVRSIWRALRGGKACSSCSSSGDCPLVNQNLVNMSQQDSCGPNTFQCPDHQKKSDNT